MFGRSRPITFDPYGSRRGRRVPRWILLLLIGFVLGAVAIVVVQERWLPPRLSADASARLRASFEQAEAQRARLAAELEATGKRLAATSAERESLAAQLATTKA